MEKLEKIKEKLREYGFEEKDENRFVYENVSYNTMNINGKVIKQKVSNTVSVVYTGTGGTMEDSDNCLDDMMFFDIYTNDELEITVGAYSFKEIAETLNIKWSEEDSDL